MKKAPKSYQNKTEIIPSEDSLLKFLSQVEIPNPLKRCLKCKGCTDCRKSYLPDQQKNEAMNEVLKKSVSYNQKEKFFVAKYIYKEELKTLSTYEREVLRMMISLEQRLIRSNKVKHFNDQVADFFARDVFRWVPTAEIDNVKQKSFIPLTFAEKSEGTTKLRVC